MRVGPINMSKSMQFFLYVSLWPFLHTTKREREETLMNQDTHSEGWREGKNFAYSFPFECDSGHFSSTLTSVYMSVILYMHTSGVQLGVKVKKGRRREKSGRCLMFVCLLFVCLFVCRRKKE